MNHVTRKAMALAQTGNEHEAHAWQKNEREQQTCKTVELDLSCTVPVLPENGGVADVLRLQGHALQELIAQAVVKGAVETRGAPVRLQHSEALHLIVSVYEQLRFVAVDTHQHHVLQGPTHVAANQLVGDAIGESLVKTER